MRYCTKCGTQFEDNVKFCPECGAAVVSAAGGRADDGPAADATRKMASVSDQVDGRARAHADQAQATRPYAARPYGGGAPGVSSARKKPTGRKALVAAAIVGAFVLGGVGAGAFIALSGNGGATQQTAVQSQKADATKTDSSAGSSGKKTTVETGDTKATDGSSAQTKSDASSNSAVTDSTTGDADAQVRKQAALDFCKTWWTNVTVKSDSDASYAQIDDWVNRVCDFLDPSSSLYAELTRGKGADILDAEDICTNAELVSYEGNTVRATADVAAHRENPTSNWSIEPLYTYVMSIDFNDSNKITGFTCYYTDNETGKTYSTTY